MFFLHETQISIMSSKFYISSCVFFSFNTENEESQSVNFLFSLDLSKTAKPKNTSFFELQFYILESGATYVITQQGLEKCSFEPANVLFLRLYFFCF